MRDSIENISQLQKQLNALQLENQMLKNILDNAGLSYHKELFALRQSGTKEAYAPEQGKRIIPPPVITENMANQFFGMFWGRQDVYAKRSVNKENGKAAYYPQCNNFWTNVCHKKKKDGVSCKDCRNRSYKAITKKDILNHLQGKGFDFNAERSTFIPSNEWRNTYESISYRKIYSLKEKTEKSNTGTIGGETWSFK